jgi:hypothetical protein
MAASRESGVSLFVALVGSENCRNTIALLAREIGLNSVDGCRHSFDAPLEDDILIRVEMFLVLSWEAVQFSFLRDRMLRRKKDDESMRINCFSIARFSSVMIASTRFRHAARVRFPCGRQLEFSKEKPSTSREFGV